MKWRDVFDTYKLSWSKVRFFDEAREFVENTGYTYFTWNDKVYSVLEKMMIPVCSVDELE